MTAARQADRTPPVPDCRVADTLSVADMLSLRNVDPATAQGYACFNARAYMALTLHAQADGHYVTGPVTGPDGTLYGMITYRPDTDEPVAHPA